jgi:hypothetical protein
MVPKLTSPLVKGVRTTEGILVLVFNVAMLVIPIITSALPAHLAAEFAMFTNVAYAVSRSALKAISALSQQTGITPSQIGPSEAQLQNYAGDADSIVKEIENTVQATEAYQNSPGQTDPAKADHALAPDPPAEGSGSASANPSSMTFSSGSNNP